MKVSEITVSNVAEYLRIEPSEYTETSIQTLLETTKVFISGYTGIPITSTDTSVKTLDDYEDFYIVVMVLCQDMYDNRTLYIEKNNLNKVVETILGMHSTNLL